jgi:hypothetical protein
MDTATGWIQSLMTLAACGVAGVGGLLYAYQARLIYPAHMPEGSRQQVDTPDMYGMPFQNVRFQSGDGTRLHGYWITQKSANAPTIVYCHVRPGCVRLM